MKKKKIKSEKKENIKVSPKSQNKKAPKWFYLVLIIIPIVFIILLEIILRAVNNGTEYKQFVSISDYYPNKQYLNPDLPKKYFYNITNIPSVIPDGFDIEKQPNTFRIFVLGESSAAGWPYVPNASFPRQLKRKLELYYPENTIEVINCGVSAINTYTIRDLVPGIIKEKPDLILIYTGHNEYYGALGVASSVGFINSRFLVNTYLWLSDFRTVQLIQNIISWSYGLFSKISEDGTDGGNETLMSRMIGESLITLNSGLFNSGIGQFEGNMNDILNWFNEAGIPVIIGNLTCNTKDLKPFVSVKTEELPAADEIYNNALEELKIGNKEKAKELFLYAKELDALRFRAPQKVNETIKTLAAKYKIPLANIDSAFKANSPDEIVGYNLTVDHLHPNIDGYRIISDEFFNEMRKNNLLPKGVKKDISDSDADKYLKENFPFTKLDSTVANMKLIVLTGNYPFVPKGTPNYKMLNFKPVDMVDTIAVKLINQDIPWETAHANLSDYYFYKGEYDKSIKEIEAVIAERPYFDIPYKDIVTKIVLGHQLEQAESFLIKLHSLKPDYFSYKWLGQVRLKQNKVDEALSYLEEAVKFKEADYQTYYNLAGAYYLKGNIPAAITAVEKSLKLNSRNKSAIAFYYKLKSLSNKKTP
jgi:tetratricopeptide (TPR) repeat protein